MCIYIYNPYYIICWSNFPQALRRRHDFWTAFLQLCGAQYESWLAEWDMGQHGRSHVTGGFRSHGGTQ